MIQKMMVVFEITTSSKKKNIDMNVSSKCIKYPIKFIVQITALFRAEEQMKLPGGDDPVKLKAIMYLFSLLFLGGFEFCD